MHFTRQALKATRRFLLGGDSDTPAQSIVPMRDPQSEITVWLHGAGDPRDVTGSHLMACAAPFTIGIHLDFEPGKLPAGSELSLAFRERRGDRRLLGVIGLRYSAVVSSDSGGLLHLFHARSCRNYCLPAARLWTYYLYQEYLKWRGRSDTEVPMSAREAHAMIVFFICPRPVVLVSAADAQRGNIFPMNLMGAIGHGYFAFSLNSNRQAAPLVERACKVALSSVPFEQHETARRLGKNHRLGFVDWNQLPFPTEASRALALPVPAFALRVREMEVEAVRKLGSHTLFVARIIQDEFRRNGLQFSVVHGVYQRRRQRSGFSAEAVRLSGRL